MKNYLILNCGLYLYHGCGAEVQFELSNDGHSVCRTLSIPLEPHKIISFMHKILEMNFENGDFIQKAIGKYLQLDDDGEFVSDILGNNMHKLSEFK